MWDAGELQRLKLWHAAGLSQGEIAKRLGRTKHAVASKCHLLGLRRVAKPVPPQRGEPRAPEIPRAGRTTLPTLPSLRGD